MSDANRAVAIKAHIDLLPGCKLLEVHSLSHPIGFKEMLILKVEHPDEPRRRQHTLFVEK